MKTDDELPIEVAEQVIARYDALEDAKQLVAAWEPIEVMYQAQKATLSDERKLAIRRVAIATRDALVATKDRFADSERWLRMWSDAGQRRIEAFLAAGTPGSYEVPDLEPATAKADVTLPDHPATDILDGIIDHLAALTYSGDLWQVFARSEKEA